MIRPWSAHQRTVDEQILQAIDALERRLRRQEQLGLEKFVEDVLSALETLRRRVEAIDERDASAAELVSASRAVPYMAGDPFQLFDEPVAGTVLGYRDEGGATPGGEAAYRAFEDVFRGPEERVRERQRPYVELIGGREPVLDVGCGRGEFLDLLREAGLDYAGVELDAGMVEHCRAKGHDKVELGDAVGYLERVPDGSLGAVFSAQVVEHLPYERLLRMLELSRGALQPGGLFIAETVNPHAAHALKTFWVDPTHQHPLFPEVMLELCRLAGFASAYVFHPDGRRDVAVDRHREGAYAVVAASPAR
jgi:SAM-dependent methyltransferase